MEPKDVKEPHEGMELQTNELAELRELISFLKQNDIAEFERTSGEKTLRIKFTSAVAPVAAPAFDLSHLAHLQASAAAASSASTPQPAATPITALVATVEPEEKLHEVKSPIVGTFYESSAPGSAPFIKVGDVVEVGQVLCIVEAMKLMNEIESDVAGEVVKIIAKNGQAVEYGLPLFAVRPR